MHSRVSRFTSAGVPKVMLAALGDQMLKVAGRRTDGTILWCVGPKTIRTHIAPIINEAAAAADRAASPAANADALDAAVARYRAGLDRLLGSREFDAPGAAG